MLTPDPKQLGKDAVSHEPQMDGPAFQSAEQEGGPDAPNLKRTWNDVSDLAQCEQRQIIYRA